MKPTQRTLFTFLALAIGTLGLTAACGADPKSTSSEPIMEERFKALLSLEEVQAAMLQHDIVTVELINFKELAEGVDPAQTAAMDSFWGNSFQTQDRAGGMTLAVIDFLTPADAEERLSITLAESDMQEMDDPIGDRSFTLALEGQGSAVWFIKGDRSVQLHASWSPGHEAQVDLEAMLSLARLVEPRL